jgi:hypothetical protein
MKASAVWRIGNKRRKTAIGGAKSGNGENRHGASVSERRGENGMKQRRNSKWHQHRKISAKEAWREAWRKRRRKQRNIRRGVSESQLA